MKISYLVFSHNETHTLSKLLDKIITFASQDNDEVIISDDYSDNVETVELLNETKLNKNVTVVNYKLENDYADKKNKALQHCTGDYIFAIDGDERPTDELLINIKDIINTNPTIETFWIPRVNIFLGVTDKHAKQWGWKLSPSKTIEHCRTFKSTDYEYDFLKNNNYIIGEHEYKVGNEKNVTVQHRAVLVNFPDPQGRLFLNKPDKIKWEGRLHERISGNANYVHLPHIEELALYHDKTIEKQIQTNLRYNKNFSQKENQGFVIPK